MFYKLSIFVGLLALVQVTLGTAASLVYAVAGLVLLAFSSMRLKGKSRYVEAKNIKICTFANHKGGVGKTTTSFFTIREILKQHKDKRVLVIDASTAGDITKFLLGPRPDNSRQRGEEVVLAGCTIEDCIEKSKTPKAFYEFWKKPFSVEDHIFQVKKACNSAPSNLYLMTNKKQYSYKADDRVPDLDDADISNICSQIRKDLVTKSKEWLIFLDTDGGEMHGFTRLAIGLADSIIIPLTAFMGAEHDSWRLEILFQYAESLRRQGLSNATVDYAFFNNISSSRNTECEVSTDKKTHPMAFTPSKEALEVMSSVMKKFDADNGWIDRYPDLLRPMTRAGCFGIVRAGGKEFATASSTPWEKEAGNAQGDIQKLTENILAVLLSSVNVREGAGGTVLFPESD